MVIRSNHPTGSSSHLFTFPFRYMLFIVIPGLILVALMVYTSTRIKRTAAEAFESETVETDAFLIQKPEGFLHVVNGDPQFAFDSYSNEFGSSGSENIRLGTAKLKVFDGKTVDEALADARVNGDAIGNDLREVVGGVHYRVVEAERTEKETAFRVRYKLAAKNGGVYRFETVNLADAPDEFVRKIDTMLDSFEVK